jgi:hypothetical protein
MLRPLLYLVLSLSFLGCNRAPADPCAGSDECRVDGRCAPLQGRCIAVTDAHCRSAQNCQKLGQCSVQNGRCSAVTVTDCQTHSTLCAEAGMCVPRGGVCAATTGTSCKKARGRMMKIDRSWVSVGLCQGLGQCQAIDGRCQSRSHGDCELSFICREWGRCHAYKGTCLANSDADCRKSRACREMGACQETDGKCMKP